VDERWQLHAHGSSLRRTRVEKEGLLLARRAGQATLPQARGTARTAQAAHGSALRRTLVKKERRPLALSAGEAPQARRTARAARRQQAGRQWFATFRPGRLWGVSVRPRLVELHPTLTASLQGAGQQIGRDAAPKLESRLADGRCRK
jgi:hypothetical protein